MESVGSEFLRRDCGAVSVHGGFDTGGKWGSGCPSQRFAAIVQLAAVLCGVGADGGTDRGTAVEVERSSHSNKDVDPCGRGLGVRAGARTLLRQKHHGGQARTNRIRTRKSTERAGKVN